MSPPDCRDDLIRRNHGIRTVAKEGTVLFSSALVFREMIDAYIADGNGFLAKNDIRNAYASYWYALGWMDAGIFLGLLSSPPPGIPLDFPHYTATDPDTGSLVEKTARYRSLLGQALESLEISSDEGSSLFPAAKKILGIAGSIFCEGIVLEDQASIAGALGAYSYGFAWLDAGARFGLFRIIRNRELFTI
jgi:hypothetical protein